MKSAGLQVSQFLKDKIAEHILEAMVPEHHACKLWYLIAAINHQLYYGVEMGFAGRNMPWIDVIWFESSEE